MILSKNWKLLVALCSLLVGILVMYQLKSGSNLNSEGQQNTISTLVQYSFAVEKLQTENQKLKDEIEKYQKGADAELVANQRLIRAKQVAALTPIEGPGIRIVLEEKEQQELLKEVERYRNKPGATSPELKQNIDNMGILSGETAVDGPGIHIEIDDTKVIQFALYDQLMEIVKP
jgi:uncharacterized protein YlxW (UPF0749 family)